MFVLPHPKQYVEILPPDVNLSGGEVFGRWLGHENVAYMNWVSALIKETQRAFSFPVMWGHSKKTTIPEPGSRALSNTKSVGALILDFSVSRTWKTNVFFIKPLNLWYLCYSNLNGLRKVYNSFQILYETNMALIPKPEKYITNK